MNCFEIPVLAWAPGVAELGIIAFIALLLFGSRLPAVARSLGKGITEFKKGLKDEPEDPNGGARPPATRGPEQTNQGSSGGTSGDGPSDHKG
ncbi:MAG: twin-arginine translocase TatA/TatE family subunit [Planctomycetota bacterium]